MRIHRFLSLTDLVVAGLVAVAVFLPKRPIDAVDPYKLAVEDKIGLGAAEARVLAHPDDGVATADLARRLSRAGQIDWGVEVATNGAARATPATRWSALFAEAEVHGDRIDVVAALDAAHDALAACAEPGATCPEWQQIKIGLYAQYLEAGVQSGIDPHKQPRAFRDAANAAMHEVDIHGLKPGRGP